MANATFRAVQLANNLTAIADDDIVPAVASPYGVGDDGGYTGATIKEAIRDAVAAFAAAGTGISIVHDDPTDTLTISSTITQYTDQDALDALSDEVTGNGIIVRTSAGNFNSRTIQAGSGIDVTNGNGVSGDPTIGIANGGVDTAQMALDSVDSTIIDGADAANIRTLLGLGTASLEDYEEGSYTPTVAFATPGTSSFSYTTQFGRYTKIGRLVEVETFINFTPTIGTGSGQLRHSLPFTSLSNAFGSGSVRTISLAFTWPAGYTDLSIGMASAADYCTLNVHGTGVSTTQLSASHMTSGSGHNYSFTTFQIV